MTAYPTISTRCGTLFTMPRMADVFGRSTTWFSRVKPSPLITLLCFMGEQIADRTCLIWIIPLPVVFDVLVVILIPELLAVGYSLRAKS
jgi:hypothetical protein